MSGESKKRNLVEAFEEANDNVGNAPQLGAEQKCRKAGRLEVAPNPHHFGAVIVGQPSDQNFVLSNVGNGPLFIEAAALTLNPGDFAITVDPSGATVQAGATTTATVRFTPGQVGARADNLRVTTDAGVTNVPITGTGRQLPVLAVRELTFAQNRAILNDSAVAFAAPEWQHLRASQHPVAYVRNTPIRITARFAVTTQPSQDDQVNVRGTATFGGTQLTWTQNNVAVAANAINVTTNAMDSDVAVPDLVQVYGPITITWEFQAGGGAWTAAGTTDVTIYSLLAAPVDANKMYWTLVHMSCTGSAGATTANEVVTGTFTQLTPPNPNANVTRKRDGTLLTYWGNGNAGASTTADSMARVDGSCQCGAWSEMLIDMYGIHGIAGGIKVNVKNYHRHMYPAATIGIQVTNAVGQNSANPPRGFANHFIVRDPVNHRYYDPSYGTGPFNDVTAWKVGLSHSFLNANQWVVFQSPVTVQSPVHMTIVSIGGILVVPPNTPALIPQHVVVSCSAPLQFDPGNAGHDIAFINNANGVLLEHG